MAVISRRNILSAGLAGLIIARMPLRFVDFAEAEIIAPANLITVYPLVSRISHPIITCSALEKELIRLKERLEKVKSDRSLAGRELKALVLEHRKQWSKVLSDSVSTATQEQKRLFINGTVSAAGLVLIAIAIPLTSPVAIGAAMGAQLLLGPAALVAHSISSKGGEVEMIFGYTGDRTLGISGLTGEVSNSTAGKIIGRSVTILQVCLDVWSLIDSGRSYAEAMEKAEKARLEIKNLNDLVDELQDKNIRWANLHKNILEGLISGLEKYTSIARGSDCIIIPPIKNPLP